MTRMKLTVAAWMFALALTELGSRPLTAVEFTAEATALPFPPDARELEFVAWAGDIKFKSSSPLTALGAFYLKEMAARGWEHDEAAAKIDKDSIELKFKQGSVEIELDLSQWSKEVRASLDCKKLKFTGTDDPAKLAAAGIPVPPAVMFLHREVPLPAGIQSLRHTGDGCTFQSPMTLQESFDHFVKLAQAKGFRESRRPIVDDTRRYTELKKGAAELSVNVFTHQVGSRIVLTYKDDAPAKAVPPLAAVASLPLKNGGTAAQNAAGGPAANATGAAPASATPIDVASNKGSATVTHGGKTYTFSHVASFQTKSRGTNSTFVVFSAKPIPVAKMQSLIASQDDFSFGDLYEFSSPDRLLLQLGNFLSFTFNCPGTVVGNSIDNPVNEMKLEAGRVRGTLKMPPQEVFREPFSFTATVDAAIITPSTRIAGPGNAGLKDLVLKSDSPILADAPIPFPDSINDITREGTKFRKMHRALASLPLAETAAFYRQALAAKGWTSAASDPATGPIRFRNDKLDATLTLKAEAGKTVIEAVTLDSALARQQGVLPEPGKGRLILGNANNVPVTFSIGQANYPLKAGQGGEDYSQALKYSLTPGKYTVVLKAAGQTPQTEKIDVTAGSTWGIIALPMGGCLPVQLY